MIDSNSGAWKVQHTARIEVLAITLIFLFNFTFSSIECRAQLSFSEIAVDASINHVHVRDMLMGGGVAIFDYNNDGLEDIYLTGGQEPDALFRNLGNMNFENVSEFALPFESHIYSTGVVTADFDNDGDRDIWLNTEAVSPCRILLNSGDGTFTDHTEEAGLIDTVWTTASSVGDFNQDGFLDVYAANYVRDLVFLIDSTTMEPYGFDHDCFENLLYINQGDGSFVEVSEEWGANTQGCALATAVSDVNRDGYPDIIVANDFGEWVTPNALLLNQDGTSFEDISSSSGMDIGIYGMGIGIGDYDHDLDLDYYITNLGRNILMDNQDDLTFIESATFAGVEDTWCDSGYAVGWGTAFQDFNNDSWADLFVANGYIPSLPFITNPPKNDNKLFLNNGDGTLTDFALSLGVSDSSIARGMACGDLDNDGDLDLVVAITKLSFSEGQNTLVYKNDLDSDNNWVQLDLVGLTGNADAFGANIIIYVGDESWLQEVNGGSSHGSQNSSRIHIGLAEEETADSIQIFWPGGNIQTLTDIASGQLIHLIEDTLNVSTSIQNELTGMDAILLSIHPNPASEFIIAEYYISSASEVRLAIYDLFGRIVQEEVQGMKAPGDYRVKINLDDIEKGASSYILKVFTETETSESTFIILK